MVYVRPRSSSATSDWRAFAGHQVKMEQSEKRRPDPGKRALNPEQPTSSSRTLSPPPQANWHPTTLLCPSRPPQHHAVTNHSAVEGVGQDDRPGGLGLDDDHHPREAGLAMPLFRHGRRLGPQAHLRRPPRPGPHLPEPLRPLPARPQARQEDGRLAQDQGDPAQGPRLDHWRDQDVGAARPRRRRLPLWSEMGSWPRELGTGTGNGAGRANQTCVHSRS